MNLNKDKIKSVIFDWGGVCCKEGEPFASLDLQVKLNMSPDEIAKRARAIYYDYYIGKHDKDSFWNSILNFFSLENTPEINPHSLSLAYLNSYKIYQPVLDLAKTLQKKYQIGLLSNLTPEMRDFIKTNHNLDDYFPVQVYSCDRDLMAMKPDVAPYLFICSKLNREPSECLFIDNSQKNIDAAGNLGMQTVLFENPDKFLKDIQIIL